MAHEEVKEKLDEFHYHEILDRLAVSISNIDNHILQHPVGKVERNVKQNVDKAIEYLCIAYQEVGSLSLNRFKNE